MYLLMNKENPVAAFSVQETMFGREYRIESISGRLPYGFSNLNDWIENRKASKHNAHLAKLMADCGCDTAEGFIKFTHAASMNDTFWIKTETEPVTWDQVSLFRNEFNETVSKLAFEGGGLYGIGFSTTSPELTTDGTFRKCWKREEDGIYLYKRGSDGAANTGMEPYSEVLASELASCLCTESVSYQLTKLNGKTCSKCRLFTDETYGYVPIYKCFDTRNISPGDMFQFYTEHGFEEQFRRMVVCDALTFNIDRHAGNHGILVKNDTLEIERFAPVFDFNLALLPYVMQDEFSDISSVLLRYSPVIGDDFTRIGQTMLTPSIRTDLINLKGFHFSYRGDSKFTKARIKALEEIVNLQIDGILRKEPLLTKQVFAQSPKKQKTINRVFEADLAIAPYQPEWKSEEHISVPTREESQIDSWPDPNLDL